MISENNSGENAKENISIFAMKLQDDKRELHMCIPMTVGSFTLIICLIRRSRQDSISERMFGI